MRSFLTRVALFLILYLICIQVVDSLFSHGPFYGNDQYAAKISYLKESNQSENINTLFFGSSRIYRQVIPSLFDSIVNQNTYPEEVNSFNFGGLAIFPPESYMLYENYINQEGNQIRNAFIELQEIPTLNDNVLSVQGAYWLDWKEYGFMTNYFLRNPHHSWKRKAFNLTFLNIGGLKNAFTLYQFNDNRQLNMEFLGPNSDGYYSINDERPNNPKIELRYQQFIKDTSILTQRIQSVRRKLKYDKSEVSAEHLSRINYLIELSEKQGIHLTFILCPRILSEESISLYERIPAANRIALVDVEKYPELYVSEYSFDKGHLNDEGSRKFTRLLAREFLELR